MSTQFISQQGKTALVAGLKWETLLAAAPEEGGKAKRGAAKAIDKQVRERAAEADASKIVVATSSARTAVGLYSEPDMDLEGDSDDGVKKVKPKVLHSMAAAFASKVGDTNAVMAYGLPGSSNYVIVVIEAGVPTIDEVKDSENSVSYVMQLVSGSTGFTYLLYTNDFDTFASGEQITEEDLWSQVSKKTQLRARPMNVAVLLSFTVLLLVVVGGGYGWMKYKEAEVRKERLRQAALADPTPKYREALALQIGRLGMTRDAARKVLRTMQQQPLWADGWLLTKIECKLDGTGSCTSTWARTGGTTDALVAARKPFGEEISPASTNNEVRMTWKCADLVESGIANRIELPTNADSVVLSTPIFQIWENAGIKAGVGVDGYKVWPSAPGLDTKSVDSAVVIKSRPIEVVTTALLASEVIASAPSDVWWSSISMEVKVASRADDSISVNLKGASYVR